MANLNSESTKEDWLICLGLLKKHKHYIWNSKKEIFPSKLWSLVHHAAFHSAPISIIQNMKISKYPMSLPDSEGKLPIDHVNISSTQSYQDLFKPIYQVNVLPSKLKSIESSLHTVMSQCIGKLIEKYDLILPVLSVSLEDIARQEKIYFDIPEMHGGFFYWFEFDDGNLIGVWCKSTSSFIGNSEQLHYCTPSGWKRIIENNEVKSILKHQSSYE